MHNMLMDFNSVESAASRIKPFIRVTPLLQSPLLDELAGTRVLIKPENLQFSGSFKFRGAISALTTLDDEQRKRGVIAYSSGNHAQGIALATQMLGIPATIVMPKDAPKIKLANVQRYGAQIVTYERAFESREEIGQQLSIENEWDLIKPYDDERVIAGQGTVGRELLSQIAISELSRSRVLCCCGGGGLSAGICLALQSQLDNFQFHTVEPSGFDDTARSLAIGSRVANVTKIGSICDAILTPTPGEITFPILQRYAAEGLVVTEDEVLIAMRIAFETLKLVVEPGGAVALAAALFRREALGNDPLIVIISGGNVDSEMFTRALSSIPPRSLLDMLNEW